MISFTDAIILKYCFKNIAKVFRSHLNILSFLISVLWTCVIPLAVHNVKHLCV